MDWGAVLVGAGAVAMHEAALFAVTGFLILGAGDLAVDLIWFFLQFRRRFLLRVPPSCVANLPPPTAPGRIAVFIPAWDEAAVIASMLRHTLATFDHEDYRLYVGCYPNDPATAAAAMQLGDPRLRVVTGTMPGPTTKADCLNAIWRGMCTDEAADGRPYKAVVLHDAEDVVHSAELKVFDSLIERFDLVQLPVLPLIDRGSRAVAGHYADEFAEAHGKELVVRAALGAALPSAGVGCALSRPALAALAGASGVPFDADSITEDYELGLRLRGAGLRSAFVRLPGAPGRAAIATRGHFPTTLDAAVNQKSRWMAGVALAGWDRLGWSGGLAERWMRLRDRQAPFAALLLCVAYVALLMLALLTIAEAAFGATVPPQSDLLLTLTAISTALLLWRLGMRFAFVTHAYGWREGLRSIPRVLVGNIVAMRAARKAVARYLHARRTGTANWDKTAHVFPVHVPAE